VRIASGDIPVARCQKEKPGRERLLPGFAGWAL